MSNSQSPYSVAMSMSPPAPADLGSYARIMHQHTKRQMEAVSSSSPPGSSNGGSQHSQSSSPTGLHGGQQSSSSRNSSECSYQG